MYSWAWDPFPEVRTESELGTAFLTPGGGAHEAKSPNFLAEKKI